MHSIQQLRWRDVLNDVLFPSELTFEWIKLSFSRGFQSNDRDGLYVHGPHGTAEVSPLPGYFDREIDCLVAAVDTVTSEWPQPKIQEIAVNTLVSSDYDLDEEFLKAYPCLKVKVHTLQDCERVKKVRDICGPNVKIRIDCNGRFSVDEALEVIDTLKSVDLELVEQPCKSNKRNAKLRRRISIPLAIDETARTHSEIQEAKELEAADVILVKVQTSGGIHKAGDLIDDWGGDVIIAHMMESEVGVNVGLALAKSLDSQKFAFGLDLPKLNNVLREPLDI